MTLLDIRTTEALPAPAMPAVAGNALQERALATADQFRQFLLQKRGSAHAQFMLNLPGEPDDNERHGYFAEALLAMPGISLPESLEVEAMADRHELDGKSIALYRNNHLGLFVARQVILTDAVSLRSDAPALYVDYLAGSFGRYPEMARSIVTVAA